MFSGIVHDASPQDWPKKVGQIVRENVAQSYTIMSDADDCHRQFGLKFNIE